MKNARVRTMKDPHTCVICYVILRSRDDRRTHYNGALHKMLAELRRTYKGMTYKVKTLEEKIEILKDKEPILGLDSIYMYAPDEKEERLYECRMCNCVMKSRTIYCHVIGVQHRVLFLNQSNSSAGIGKRFQCDSLNKYEFLLKQCKFAEKLYGKKEINVVDGAYVPRSAKAQRRDASSFRFGKKNVKQPVNHKGPNSGGGSTMQHNASKTRGNAMSSKYPRNSGKANEHAPHGVDLQCTMDGGGATFRELKADHEAKMRELYSSNSQNSGNTMMELESDCDVSSFWCNEELFEFLGTYKVESDDDVAFARKVSERFTNALVRQKTRMEALRRLIADSKKRLKVDNKASLKFPRVNKTQNKRKQPPPAQVSKKRTKAYTFYLKRKYPFQNPTPDTRNKRGKRGKGSQQSSFNKPKQRRGRGAVRPAEYDNRYNQNQWLPDSQFGGGGPVDGPRPLFKQGPGRFEDRTPLSDQNQQYFGPPMDRQGPYNEPRQPFGSGANRPGDFDARPSRNLQFAASRLDDHEPRPPFRPETDRFQEYDTSYKLHLWLPRSKFGNGGSTDGPRSPFEPETRWLEEPEPRYNQSQWVPGSQFDNKGSFNESRQAGGLGAGRRDEEDDMYNQNQHFPDSRFDDRGPYSEPRSSFGPGVDNSLDPRSHQHPDSFGPSSDMRHGQWSGQGPPRGGSFSPRGFADNMRDLSPGYHM
ncbi:uncharacterized protein LOC142108527 isoform X2 [Mixophyes fleayi]|uniref:uncharacterized protein LOC142108527 isoform X2 n=1 Tax=Mixophyes fleayi TaxID=3061075 RepID=UPI003F4D94B8